MTRVLAAMAVLAVAVTPMGGQDDYQVSGMRQGNQVPNWAPGVGVHRDMQRLPSKSHTIVVQGLATDGIAIPLPTPMPPPPAPEPTVEAQPITYGQCPALIANALGWAGCAVSYCESHWNPNATGAAGERGWFQVMPFHHDSTYDPAGNVAAAVRISNGGTDWRAWSVRNVLTTGVCPNGDRPPM